MDEMKNSDQANDNLNKNQYDPTTNQQQQIEHETQQPEPGASRSVTKGESLTSARH